MCYPYATHNGFQPIERSGCIGVRGLFKTRKRGLRGSCPQWGHSRGQCFRSAGVSCVRLGSATWREQETEDRSSGRARGGGQHPDGTGPGLEARTDTRGQEGRPRGPNQGWNTGALTVPAKETLRDRPGAAGNRGAQSPSRRQERCTWRPSGLQRLARQTHSAGTGSLRSSRIQTLPREDFPALRGRWWRRRSAP